MAYRSLACSLSDIGAMNSDLHQTTQRVDKETAWRPLTFYWRFRQASCSRRFGPPTFDSGGTGSRFPTPTDSLLVILTQHSGAATGPRCWSTCDSGYPADRRCRC